MAWPSPLSLPPPSCCEEKRKRRRKRKKKKKRRRKEKKKKTRNSTLICKKQNSVWDNGGTLKWAGQSRAATRNEYLKETSVLARFSAKTWETSWSAHVRRSQRKKVGGRSWSGRSGGGYVQFSCPSRRDRVPRVPGPRVLLRRRSRRDASPR